MRITIIELIAIVILGLVIGMAFYSEHRNRELFENCSSKGGVLIQSVPEKVCVKLEVVK